MAAFLAAAAKPVLMGLISSILGKKDNQQSNQMQFNGANRTQIGDVTGNPQPQQAPATDPGMQQPDAGNKFQNGMSKVSTIANILQSLRGNQQNAGAYQMQTRRR